MDNNSEEKQMNKEQEIVQNTQVEQENSQEVSIQVQQEVLQPQEEPPQSQAVPPQSQAGPSQSQQSVSWEQQAQQFAKQVGNQVENFTKNKELLEKVGLICACAGFVISFIFTIVSCSRSAYNSISMKGLNSLDSISNLARFETFRGSYFFIVVLIGMIIAIAGGVMAFMSKRGDDFGMMAKITFLVVVITLILAIIPNVTICAYNQSLNHATEDMMKEIANQYSSWY